MAVPPELEDFPKKPTKHLEQYENFEKNEMVFKLKQGEETLHTARASMEALAKLPKTYVQEILAKEYVKKKYLTEHEASTLFASSTQVLKIVNIHEVKWGSPGKMVVLPPAHSVNPDNLGVQAEGLKKMIPGLREEFSCPHKTCTNVYMEQNKLFVLIQHVNDAHKWTREEIADWLESLDVDLAFKVVD